ncbi:hypothetical protein [Nocardioides panzhihuensis]|uniref:Uncharacterized protein n=1 Tax=Nocardioides panzhihuensis TaxID=860243 RepID=A0A7Z0DH87_9ACTN|nr:hypothetical protein [Nocardioides panzhihuensis]NYI75550.1 hypothetical protein [Nocardioides panzhihuensis]
MELRVGLALASAVDSTNVIVTKAPAGDIALTCGGVPLIAKGSTAPAVEADPEHMKGSLLGKRYVDPDEVIEVLVTKGGDASLALDGVLLEQAGAKALPSSD